MTFSIFGIILIDVKRNKKYITYEGENIMIHKPFEEMSNEEVKQYLRGKAERKVKRKMMNKFALRKCK